jgi:hypothetical protein
MDISGPAPPRLDIQFKSGDSSPRTLRKKWDKPQKSELIQRINSAVTPQTTSHLLFERETSVSPRIDCSENRVLPKYAPEVENHRRTFSPRVEKKVGSSTWSGPTKKKEPEVKSPTNRPTSRQVENAKIEQQLLDGIDPYKVIEQKKSYTTMISKTESPPPPKIAPILADFSDQMKILEQANQLRLLEIQFSNLHIKIVEQSIMKLSELMTFDERDNSDDKWIDTTTKFFELLSSMLDNLEKNKSGIKVNEDQTIKSSDRITSDGTIVRRKALQTTTTTKTRTPTTPTPDSPNDLARTADKVLEQIEQAPKLIDSDPLVSIKRAYSSLVNQSLDWFLSTFLHKRLAFFFDNYNQLPNKTKAINNVQSIITWSQTTRSRYEQHLTDENYLNLKQVREVIVQGLNNLDC